MSTKSLPRSTVIIDMVDDAFEEDEITFADTQFSFQNSSPINVCLDTALSENELNMLPCDEKRTKLKDLLPYFPPFKCPFDQCKKVFEDRMRLQKHYRNHQEKKHKCQYCGQKFLYKKDKNIHERTHTGERPFVCHLCGRGFVQKCTLLNHLKTHDKGVKDEVCDICGRAYAYKKSLAQHKQLKHSSLLTDDIFHSCGKCGKKYKGLYQYKNHVAKCKQSVFKCSNCNATFQMKLDLLSHKKNCSTMQVFQCGVCNVVMKSENKLRLHMLQIHRINFNECVKVQMLNEGESTSSQSEEVSANISQEEVKEQSSASAYATSNPVDSDNAVHMSTSAEAKDKISLMTYSIAEFS